jgi:hypothetical protein
LAVPYAQPADHRLAQLVGVPVAIAGHDDSHAGILPAKGAGAWGPSYPRPGLAVFVVPTAAGGKGCESQWTSDVAGRITGPLLPPLTPRRKAPA